MLDNQGVTSVFGTSQQRRGLGQLCLIIKVLRAFLGIWKLRKELEGGVKIKGESNAYLSPTAKLTMQDFGDWSVCHQEVLLKKK